nr:Threonine aldolase [Polyrhizophydium stewartii]
MTGPAPPPSPHTTRHTTHKRKLGIRTHLKQPPYSVLCDARAHILNYEASGISFHCSAAVTGVEPKGPSGHLTAAQVERHLILSDEVYFAPTQLICLENTLNGSIVPLSDIKEIAALARSKGIPFHLDGARLWNASAATGVSIKEYCENFDSVSLCLSKGLGAPIGSILVGSAEFIKKARHFRKLYGGGWRQAGMLAAACLHAIEHHFPTMAQVHANAKRLSDSLVSLGFGLERRTETNMVWLDLSPLGATADDIARALLRERIRVYGGEGTVMRMVLHHQISRADVERAVAALTGFVASLKTSRKRVREEEDGDEAATGSNKR